MLSITYFKALSDLTRIRLFNVLQKHEMSVNELVSLFELGQSLISRHLKILTSSGLLSCRRDRIWAFYSASRTKDAGRFGQAIAYLFTNEAILEEDLEKAYRIVEERKQSSKSFFNSIASEWDHLKTEILTDIELNEVIGRYVKTSSIVADLGCGTGDLLDFLGPHTACSIGVDSSVKMLEQARKRFNHRHRSHIDFRLGELEHLPIGNCEVDTAIFSLVLHHLPNPERAVAESERILKSGGILIIADFGQHGNECMRKKYGDRWLGFSEDDIRGWIGRHGFAMGDETSFMVKESIQLNVFTATKK